MYRVVWGAASTPWIHHSVLFMSTIVSEGMSHLDHRNSRAFTHVRASSMCPLLLGA